MQSQREDAPAPFTRRAGAVLLADRDGSENSPGPWAFARAGTKTLLELCTGAVDQCPGIVGFVVVALAGTEDRVADLAHASPKFLAVVPGGASTMESLASGVAALPAGFELVVVHETVRPLASPELLMAVIRALDGGDVATPHIPVSDTVKRVENGMVLETVPRSELTILQTPWAFRRETLEGVYPTAFQGGADSAPRLRQGFSGILLDGEPANIKVRTMEDLRLVERLLAATHPADGR